MSFFNRYFFVGLAAGVGLTVALILGAGLLFTLLSKQQMGAWETGNSACLPRLSPTGIGDRRGVEASEPRRPGDFSVRV